MHLQGRNTATRYKKVYIQLDLGSGANVRTFAIDFPFLVQMVMWDQMMDQPCSTLAENST